MQRAESRLQPPRHSQTPEAPVAAAPVPSPHRAALPLKPGQVHGPRAGLEPAARGREVAALLAHRFPQAVGGRGQGPPASWGRGARGLAGVGEGPCFSRGRGVCAAWLRPALWRKKLFLRGVELEGGGVVIDYGSLRPTVPRGGCIRVCVSLSSCNPVCALTCCVSVHSRLSLWVTRCFQVCVHQLCTCLCVCLVVPVSMWRDCPYSDPVECPRVFQLLACPQVFVATASI